MGKQSSLSSLLPEAGKRNICVVDDDYKNSRKYKDIAKQLEKILNEYIKVLDTLSEASSGKFAENLKELKELVNSKLSDILLDTYLRFSDSMKDYKSRINAADSDMY